MRRVIAMLAALAFGPAQAQVPPTPDHLTPIDNVYTAPWIYDFEAYDADVVDVLGEVFDIDVFARMVATPSFTPEYAVGLRSDTNDVFSVIALRPSHHVLLFSELYELENRRSDATDEEDEADDDAAYADKRIAELRAALPESIDDVTVETCSIDLVEEAATTLHTLWGEMLFRTRYEDKRPVTIGAETPPRPYVDGVRYHFGFDYGENLTGQTHEPNETSMPGRFVAVAETLNRACWAQNEGLIGEAVAAAEAMLGELAGSRY